MQTLITNAAEVAKVVSDSLNGSIRNAAALANVESLQIQQRVGQPDEAFVRDVTGAHRELFQAGQTLSHVSQGLVVDLVAKGNIQRSDPGSPFSQIGLKHDTKRNTV